MRDSMAYPTIQNSHGRLLQSPPLRCALPAPTSTIAGLLPDGLPAIEMPESIPLLLSMSAVEDWLKEKTGFRNSDEITAYFDARLAAKKKQDYERLMQHPAFRRWANRRVS